MTTFTLHPEHLRRPGPDSADRRDHILDAAERLFADVGFAAASMREIAQASGVNVATVYYHCGSKEQLFLSIYARLIERIGSFVGETFASGVEFKDVVGNALDRVVELFVRNPSIPRLLLRASLGEIPGADDSRRAAYRPLFELVADELERRAESGEIRWVQPLEFLSAATGVVLHLALEMTDPVRMGGRREIDPDLLASIQGHARMFILGALGLEARSGAAELGLRAPPSAPARASNERSKNMKARTNRRVKR